MTDERMVELAKVIACALWRTPEGNQDAAWDAVSQDTRDSFVGAARAACLFLDGEN